MRSSFYLLCLSLLVLSRALSSQEVATRTFDPQQIQVMMNPDVDIVYHVLAHFSVPGDPSNLFSTDYLTQIRKAKQDLEVGPTKLDTLSHQLEEGYRQHPRLRFLNLALFMADDYASFKQGLMKIDYNVEAEAPEDSRDTLEERRAREAHSPLLFGNAKRLIPLFQKRFPDPAERQFVKQFAECMEDEYNQFYKVYRESRTELDQEDSKNFNQFWKSSGSKILWPWAARSGVNVFNIYLCPVMRNNGRGVPVNQEQRVLFNVVAPLPETSDQAVNSFFVVLHETTHRLTDGLVESGAPPSTETNALRENAAFYADHLYLKKHYPQYYTAYLRFFLNLPPSRKFDLSSLENEFLKSYPLPVPLKGSVEQLVGSMQQHV
jgi:hypothetical protein